MKNDIARKPGQEKLESSAEPNEASERALAILGMIESTPRDELRKAVFSASPLVFEALRGMILRDPAERLEEGNLARFLDINRLRGKWLANGWKPFFVENESPPMLAPELARSKQPEGATRGERLGVSLYPQDDEIIREVRWRIEDAGLKRIADSEVAVMGLRALASNNPDLKLYGIIRQGDLRHPGNRAGGQPCRRSLSIVVHPQDRATLKEARRFLESAGTNRVTDSEIVRMGLRLLSDVGDLVKLYQSVITR